MWMAAVAWGERPSLLPLSHGERALGRACWWMAKVSLHERFFLLAATLPKPTPVLSPRGREVGERAFATHYGSTPNVRRRSRVIPAFGAPSRS